MPTSADGNGTATRLTAEAQVALGAGDTDRARALFRQAGEHLEARVENTPEPSEKQLLRFLAATQFYKGGYYQKARSLCQKVQANLLPAEARGLYPRFVQDVGERARPDYPAKVRQALLRHWQKKDYQGILGLLQEHLYVLPRGGMAFLRAVCCEHLKDYQAAALFFADALRGAPQDPGLVFTSTAFPLALAREGDLSEAWRYVECLLREIPHPVTYINASLLRYHQASRADTEEERRRLSEDQLRYFEEAWARYQQLPPDQGTHPDMRAFLALCFEAAAFGLIRLGERARALEVCDTAVALDPSSPGPRTVRGMITYPDPKAVEDFREAIRLGDEHYFPYYFLAHAALVGGQFTEAEDWCRKALQRRPSQTVEAQLVEWTAICRAQLGAPREEVEELFDRAQQLDPCNARIRHNKEVYAGAVVAPDGATAERWDWGDLDGSGEEYLHQGEGEVTRRRDSFDWAQRELAVVGT